jgi:hypothetical protein
MSKSKDLFMKIRESEDFLDADYLYFQWLLQQPPKEKEVTYDNTRTEDEDYEDFIDLRPDEPEEEYGDDSFEY